MEVKTKSRAANPVGGTLVGLAIGCVVGFLVVVFFGALWLTREDVLDEMQAAGGKCQWGRRHAYIAGDRDAQSEVLRKIDVELQHVVKDRFEKGETVELIAGIRSKR